METKLLSIVDTAKQFNFPRDRLYNLVKLGRVPCITIGKKVKINTKTFADWLDELARNNEKI